MYFTGIGCHRFKTRLYLLTAVSFEIRPNWQLHPPHLALWCSALDPGLAGVELDVIDNTAATLAVDVLLYQTTGASTAVIFDWFLENPLRMRRTQSVRLLFLVCNEDFRSQLIELLPQRLFAATVELSAEAIVAQQYAEILLAQLSSELDKFIVVTEVGAACFDDVEDVVR